MLNWERAPIRRKREVGRKNTKGMHRGLLGEGKKRILGEKGHGGVIS